MLAFMRREQLYLRKNKLTRLDYETRLNVCGHFCGSGIPWRNCCTCRAEDGLPRRFECAICKYRSSVTKKG